jgi:chromosomal replication initiation ATPase DnaA
LWRQVLGLLSGRVNKPTLEAHLKPLHVVTVEEDGTVLLLAPHASTRDWIEKRHLPAVQEALSTALGRPVAVHLRLAKDLLQNI